MPKRLNDDDAGILRRALARHYHALKGAAERCRGELWPRLYAAEAERTEALLRKLLGRAESVLQKPRPRSALARALAQLPGEPR